MKSHNTFSIILLLFLFFIITPLQAGAVSFYDGSSSGIFEDNSTRITGTGVLQEIVDTVKEDISINKIEFILVCTTTFSEEEVVQLGKQRVKVLEEFFTSRLTGVEVKGMGESVNIPLSEENKPLPGEFIGPDVLVIEGSTEGITERKTEEEEREQWKSELLARYKKVEKQHRFLCAARFSTPGYLRENCESMEKESIERNLCEFRNRVYLLQYPGKGSPSIASIEYSLERIEKLESTSGEVLNIARKIQDTQKGGDKKSINLDDIRQEIESQYLAIKHLKRALQTTYKGLENLQAITASNYDRKEISEVAESYRDLISSDELFASIYARRSLRQTINKVRALHNYVRTNLGMKRLADNKYYPICVDTNSRFNAKQPTLKQTKIIYREAQFRAAKHGIDRIILK